LPKKELPIEICHSAGLWGTVKPPPTGRVTIKQGLAFMTDFRPFLAEHEKQIVALSRQVNLAYWTATTSGQPAAFAHYSELEVRLQTIYANREDFAKIRGWREAGNAANPIERRQLDLLHHAYLRNQIDPVQIETMTRLSSQIVQAFGTYRARVQDRELTGNGRIFLVGGQ
jgi:peptidyl-dipeptidase A